MNMPIERNENIVRSFDMRLRLESRAWIRCPVSQDLFSLMSPIRFARTMEYVV
jgi:hypothetical protein